MLVRDGAPLSDLLHDPEGFAAGAHQFDSDITSGRHPRAALGTSGDELIALACDGRRTTARAQWIGFRRVVRDTRRRDRLRALGLDQLDALCDFG
jgi:hypothetical protein